jgi:GNAT superfamily N-acetyltransferase
LLLLRTPHPDELDHLSALCLRSKAVWGYDAAFLEACRRELTLTASDLQESCLQLAEDEAGIAALVQVSLLGADAVLEKLFVEPARLRTGAGRLLFRWAAHAARVAGATRMSIDADPGAAAFYVRMGARPAGMVPSGSIPGRLLPRFVLEL